MSSGESDSEGSESEDIEDTEESSDNSKAEDISRIIRNSVDNARSRASLHKHKREDSSGGNNNEKKRKRIKFALSRSESDSSSSNVGEQPMSRVTGLSSYISKFKKSSNKSDSTVGDTDKYFRMSASSSNTRGNKDNDK